MTQCSIDALLDRTIKHMQFLQKVTNQAEKLKQCAQSKVSDVSGFHWHIYHGSLLSLGQEPLYVCHEI